MFTEAPGTTRLAATRNLPLEFDVPGTHLIPTRSPRINEIVNIEHTSLRKSDKHDAVSLFARACVFKPGPHRRDNPAATDAHTRGEARRRLSQEVAIIVRTDQGASRPNKPENEILDCPFVG